ncbi:MAG: 1-acyl-sn-glycerol-3-phosphate acyltransferase [Acidobacteriota bacterium]|nr:1-acyl-sn-glycerol-3-phosphate acyltransferase [Acidobacteriota bacterium]MDQ3420266.1 1-acyl-sn-glycerol-3-phosphate acyltransferase [Acidobacteriota bacterium]
MNVLRALISGLLITAMSVIVLAAAVLTLMRARSLYSALARILARAVLRVYGVRVRVISATPFPRTQVVYVSNHTSTLDLFVLVALGLPNCRFFLSGFLRKFVPLGVIACAMGTFFTVPQELPEERRRIFRRAADTLKRTGESVYLSPEGGRITTGEIGHFNKGAFHMATDLRAPIVPLYFHIPRTMDPGLGYSAGRGTVTVHVLPPIDTTGWTVEQVSINKDYVRDTFVRVHQELRTA